MKPGNSGKKDFIQVPYSGSKMADTVKVSAAQMAFGKKVGVPQGGVSELNNQRNIFFA
jgi:hypothetical protein